LLRKQQKTSGGYFSLPQPALGNIRSQNTVIKVSLIVSQKIPHSRHCEPHQYFSAW